MNAINTYFRILLLTSGLLFVTGLFAEEEEMLEEEIEELPPLYTSKIEIGVEYSSEDSFKLGEFTGLENEGAYAIGNIEIRKHSVIGDNDNRYWELTGSNLGLDSRKIFAEYSQDRLFDVYFEYDQIPRYQLGNAQTPFNGAGTTDQTLPVGWVPASDTTGMTNLLSNLKNIDIETERQRFGGGFKLNLTDSWQVHGNYRHEDKDGTETIGAIFGITGGNPRASILATPINFDTEEFDLGVAYTGDKGQYSLNYHLSQFNNNDTSVIWDTPFNNAAYAAASNFSAGARGGLGVAPDNEAWQITFAGGYNLFKATRVTANISYGEMTQDDTFLPFTNISTLTAPIALPRSNLDGEIDTLYANFNLSTRLSRKLNLKARYTYDDKDNDTPRDIYVRIANDSQDQPGLVSSNARINWPYSLERHKFVLDSSYRISPMTRFSAGYEYENKDRDFTERDETEEHKGKIKLSTSPNDSLSGWLQYSHSVRDGSTYISNKPFLTGHNPDYVAAEIAADPENVFENDPLMRKTYLADRDRDQVSATVNFYPYDTVTFTINANYANDDYKHTEIGLQNGANFNLTLDATYTPSEDVTTYAFVTNEKSHYEQAGFYHPGFAGNLGPATDRVARFGNNFWRVETEDLVNTIGFGGDWVVIEDKFNVKFDFTHSSGTTAVQPSAPSLAFLPLPDLNTKITSLNIRGDYKFRGNTILRMGYLYERYTTDDFALDNVTANTMSNVIWLGNVRSQDYNVHIVGLSLIYEF